MNKFCSIQIFLQNQWIDCATIELIGNEAKGWKASSATYYSMEHAIEYMGLRDGHAVSNHFPVNLESNNEPTWPAFLVDLLPQGYGRKELLRRLGRPEYEEESADWSLLRIGASNPIGNLRIKEAHEWLLQQYSDQLVQGFSLQEIIERSDDFLESLASFGLFISGSSGVQGEWPKLLMTQGKDGLFYLDHALPDMEAKQHWLIKFSRGTDERLNKILNQEALYMQLAEYLGLRVFKELVLHGRTLFIPRFDRQVTDQGVERIAQESLAAFSGKVGFGVTMTHNEVCGVIMQNCTNPEQEIIEYIKRDLANIALGNKDNHTRNTAFQRLTNGEIRLSPLFDFAPMWLHPDGIARCTRWKKDDNQWASIANQLTECTTLSIDQVKALFSEQLPLYQGLLDKMRAIGIDAEIIENSAHRIQNICNQLKEIGHG
ncbi:type II toxin-antitoxin system HipA family toxin [Acinetobacter sp.]|uniref:type II toxin-antitoxin system HipA family toxin n=1 Tax=Acinetobacter sp. TaxID=472 RepID=UPI0035ADE46F